MKGLHLRSQCGTGETRPRLTDTVSFIAGFCNEGWETLLAESWSWLEMAKQKIKGV